MAIYVYRLMSVYKMCVDEVSVGTSTPIVICWWGPVDPVPNGHILAEDHRMNSLVCHPDQKDTLTSGSQSRGWIKLLLSSTNPQVVADVYSVSGELHLQTCTVT